ncbi:hypothetical protein AURDEDRAFT_115850, partial [Auricularia subglabra TFB-10046 SS5]
MAAAGHSHMAAPGGTSHSQRPRPSPAAGTTAQRARRPVLGAARAPAHSGFTTKYGAATGSQTSSRRHVQTTRACPARPSDRDPRRHARSGGTAGQPPCRATRRRPGARHRS